MGKPQGYFQNSTIFGVPLIAGNTSLYTHLQDIMKKLNKILRFRFDDEVIDELKNVSRTSDYVRTAVREKLERDNFLKTEIPF